MPVQSLVLKPVAVRPFGTGEILASAQRQFSQTKIGQTKIFMTQLNVIGINIFHYCVTIDISDL